MATRASATGRRESEASSDELSFWGKIRTAYRIFFPPSAEETARQEAKKRLRMILVADRCTMSESSMDEMKMKIMDVVGEFVDVDEEQEVDVSMNTDEELGTMYAVSIPVKRVKAEYDAENDASSSASRDYAGLSTATPKENAAAFSGRRRHRRERRIGARYRERRHHL